MEKKFRNFYSDSNGTSELFGQGQAVAIVGAL